MNSIRQRISSRTAIAVMAALVAVLLGGGYALATIPDAAGAIHGCYTPANGQLRVIDPSAEGACRAGETGLAWNVAGPPGVVGGTGVQGQPGPTGFPGLPGAAGSSGYERIRVQATTDGSGNGTAEADCSSGKQPLMGGYELTTGLRALVSRPNDAATGWIATVTGTANATYAAYAICAIVTPAS